MIIEEGIMNFWAMIGGLGAFGCGIALLIIKIIEKIRNRGY